MKVIYLRRERNHRTEGWQEITQLAYETSAKTGLFDLKIVYEEPSLAMSRDNLKAAVLKKDRQAIGMVHALHQLVTERGL